MPTTMSTEERLQQMEQVITELQRWAGAMHATVAGMWHGPIQYPVTPPPPPPPRYEDRDTTLARLATLTSELHAAILKSADGVK